MQKESEMYPDKQEGLTDHEVRKEWESQDPKVLRERWSNEIKAEVNNLPSETIEKIESNNYDREPDFIEMVKEWFAAFSVFERWSKEIEKIDDEETRKRAEYELHQDESALFREIDDWERGGDVSFTKSDFVTDSDGTWRPDKIRQEIRNRREDVLIEIGLFSE